MLLPAVIQVVTELGNFIIQNLPLLMQIGLDILLQLATSITEALPTLIPAIVEVVLSIVEFLAENAELLIDAAIALIVGLAEGLIVSLPILLEKLPIIISKLVAALISEAKKLVDVGRKIIEAIRDGLENAKESLFSKAQALINNLKMKFVEKMKEFVSVGKNLVDGIKEGISNAWNNLVDWLTGLCGNLVDIIKHALGINSPSTVMADEVGQWLPAGIAQGIQDGMGVLNDTIDEMTSDLVVGSIDASADIESGIMSAGFNAGGLADLGGDVKALFSLMAQYLPQIAQGENVNITLEGDAGRLFRLMQSEQRRNTELVGI